ncbi:uncharacterized protein [Nicotiana sylvestris]|uniref:uncharacterized protein n=1 Tax=Nicotiana sylvestris TaxID=4096 RepID=UPI00388CB0EA
MTEYEACILGLRLAVDMGVQEVLVLGDSNLSVEFRHIPRIRNEVADALATLVSMLHHSNKAYVDPLHIEVRDQHAYCNVVEEELDGEPWFHDIRQYIKMRVYPVQATSDQKRTFQHLASGFFLSGGILYKRTLDLGLLRCIDAKQATTIMTEVHSGRRQMGTGLFWWPSTMMFKSVTQKAVVDFVHSNFICRFGINFIITDNGSNLNSHLMKEVCQQFNITHRNSTPYRPKENGVVEVANKNIKKILRKMVQGSRQWNEKLSFALLGYRTTVRTSVGATPYLLVNGTGAVILAEVEIPSLRIVAEAKIDDDEWVKTRLEQLSLFEEKRMTAVWHGQLYKKRMTRAYNKKVCPQKFEVGQQVLKRILPHQAEDKGKFTPNWQEKGGVTTADSDAQLASQNTSIHNLEVQLGQISQALKAHPKGVLPNDMVVNPEGGNNTRHVMAVTTRSEKGGDATTSNQRRIVDENVVIQEDEIPSNVVQANEEVRIDIDENVEETQEEVNSFREHMIDILEPVVPKAKAPMPRPPPPYP